MYDIYCTEARGREAAWGLSAINLCIPSARDITILYPVGTAIMGMRRTLEKERRNKLILLGTVLQSHSPSQLSNVERTLDHIVTEACGQIDTTID